MNANTRVDRKTVRALLNFCMVAIAVVPLVASAHVGVGDAHGFVRGFAHPLRGVDHVLAMVAVGLFAAQLGGRALWLVPLTFVSIMAVAGTVGMSGIDLPFAEVGIALSIVVLGSAIAFRVHLPTLLAAAVVGLFAMFHGHAHGAEMPESMSGLLYGAGFVSATALLHALGVGLGAAIGKVGRDRGDRIVRFGGAAISIAGIAILVSS
jgi:urease accessory protein